MIRSALLVAAVFCAAPAVAGRVGAPNGLAQQIGVAYGAIGTDAVPVDPAHPLPTADTNGAGFGGAVGPLVAGTDYSVQALRAVNVYCTAAGNVVLTLIDGSQLPFSLVVSPPYQIPFLLKSVNTIPAGCTLYGLK